MKNRDSNETEPILKPGGDGGSPAQKVKVEDDHDPVRTGLARLFAADAQLRVVSQTEIGLDAAERTLRLTPDSVMVDVWLPAGSDAQAENPTNQKSPMFKVVVLALAFAPHTPPAL